MKVAAASQSSRLIKDITEPASAMTTLSIAPASSLTVSKSQKHQAVRVLNVASPTVRAPIKSIVEESNGGFIISNPSKSVAYGLTDSNLVDLTRAISPNLILEPHTEYHGYSQMKTLNCMKKDRKSVV